MAVPQSCSALGRPTLRRAVVVGGFLAAAGCAAVAGSPGGQSPPTRPGSRPPAVAVRQVFFDPKDASTPDSRAVLAGPSQVAAYVRWLERRPVPGRASPRLVAALQRHRFD